jgi:hypothetical protein
MATGSGPVIPPAVCQIRPKLARTASRLETGRTAGQNDCPSKVRNGRNWLATTSAT